MMDNNTIFRVNQFLMHFEDNEYVLDKVFRPFYRLNTCLESSSGMLDKNIVDIIFFNISWLKINNKYLMVNSEYEGLRKIALWISEIFIHFRLHEFYTLFVYSQIFTVDVGFLGIFPDSLSLNNGITNYYKVYRYFHSQEKIRETIKYIGC